MSFLKTCAYMSSIGVVGMVLVVIGSTLEELALGVQRNATEIGSVFLSRGVGAMLGAASCSKIFALYNGHDVLTAALASISLCLMVMPFSVWVGELHLFFFILGAGTAVVDTGCQLMTRRLHGSNAGPWLGANAAVFGISAACVPLMEMVTTDIFTRYISFSAVALFASSLTIYISSIECMSNYHSIPITKGTGSGSGPGTGSGSGNRSSNNGIIRDGSFNSRYRLTEITIALMLFSFVGGGVTATAYIISYADESAAVPKVMKEKVFLVLWVFITVGRLLGIYIQRSLDLHKMLVVMACLSVGGGLSMAMIWCNPHSAPALVVGTALYGLFHGPTMGFTQDLNNRLTPLCETSMAIVMFGLVCGASFVPYFTALIWRAGGFGPTTLIVVVGLSSLLPLPLLIAAKYFSSARSETTPAHVSEDTHIRLDVFPSYDGVPVVDFVEVQYVGDEMS